MNHDYLDIIEPQSDESLEFDSLLAENIFDHDKLSRLDPLNMGRHSHFESSLSTEAKLLQIGSKTVTLNRDILDRFIDNDLHTMEEMNHSIAALFEAVLFFASTDALDEICIYLEEIDAHKTPNQFENLIDKLIGFIELGELPLQNAIEFDADPAELTLELQTELLSIIEVIAETDIQKVSLLIESFKENSNFSTDPTLDKLYQMI